jgi:aryl-alcohol dehydrogenase-like predicted oxidoreductase
VAAGLALMSVAQRLPAASRQLERAIPSSGERLPVIGLGTWQSFDVGSDPTERGAAKEVLRLFVAAGGRAIDSSPMYGTSEAAVGELAHDLGAQGSLFYATKVWTSGRDAGIAQMETSMRRMRVRRMDLMQVHNLVDVQTHLATLREWKRVDRIRYLGATHYHSGAYREVESLLSRERLDFVQINYSLAEREAEQRLLRVAADNGTAVIINRPFAGGVMFERTRDKPLPDWAREFGVESWAQFFLKWILGNNAVTCAIPATRNPKYLLDNMAAGIGRLPDQAMRKRMSEYFDRL